MKKVIISLTAIAFLFASFYALKILEDNSEEGSITIELVNERGVTIFNEVVDFKKEDTLYDVLSDNHEIGCADSSFRLSNSCETNTFTKRVILKIDNIETSWTSSYFAIYINDEYSVLGIDDLTITDGDIISFIYTTIGGGD